MKPALSLYQQPHSDRRDSYRLPLRSGADHRRRLESVWLYAPLGYVKDPDKKGHLLIDPETRWIVEKIFDLAVHGRGAASITRILVEEKVPTPGWLNYERYGTFANIYAGAPAEKAQQQNWLKRGE